MICAIHQPQTYPWLGYFAKIMQADVFIFLDNVQFKKNEWQNRNKIRTPQGWIWLTVPVIHNFGQKICEVKINNAVNWRKKHLQTLQTYYGRAPFFKPYFEKLINLYQSEWQNLAQFNIASIRLLMSLIGIDTPTVIASEIKTLDDNSLSADEKLITATKAVGSDCYLSGAGGHNYLQPELFSKNGIELRFQSFEHPVYRQMTTDFLPNMSVLDLLFNEGQRANSIIKGGIR
ncbi:MAG TPA: WbqC family protein [Candidatus Marinimicrobia bacterium]|nr:WbqC family protein [Candidatus Neomarinimicrobiota bacterium]HRS51422.1 WbqC family protein [Candidatus Neomarinimicrobiota bacterium]